MHMVLPRFALYSYITSSELFAEIIYIYLSWLTLIDRETHGCIVSTMTTDALMLKNQAISIHNAD